MFSSHPSLPPFLPPSPLLSLPLTLPHPISLLPSVSLYLSPSFPFFILSLLPSFFPFFFFLLSSPFIPSQPVKCILKHADGSTDEFTLQHSMNAMQIEWFKAGSALNHMATMLKN